MKNHKTDKQDVMITITDLNASIAETIQYILKYAEVIAKADNTVVTRSALTPETIQLLGNLTMLKKTLEGLNL